MPDHNRYGVTAEERQQRQRWMTRVGDAGSMRGMLKTLRVAQIIPDGGGELKGPVITLLEKRKIGIQRSLGGNPQQNGLVERANGKLKRIIGKTKVVRGGSWATHRQAARRCTTATPSSW